VVVPAPAKIMPSVPTSVVQMALPEPTRDFAVAVANAKPVVRTEPSVVERGFSVVRRKLLLKNRGPEDAVGLYLRAIQVYGSGEYRESLDLAWAAVQLDDQDARFWYAKALCERALGEVASARASARHGAALDVLARTDSVQGLNRVAAGERAYLREAAAGMTRTSARLIAGEAAAVELQSGTAGRVSEVKAVASKTR